MKLQKLHIESYRHLQNVKFDFTYPKGHAKAGQPLNKICLIGQSATGKTSILELIRDNLMALEAAVAGKIKHFHEFKLNFKGTIGLLSKKGPLLLRELGIQKDINPSILATDGFFLILPNTSPDRLDIDALRLLYVSADIISKDIIALFNQNPQNLISSLADEKYNSLKNKYKKSNYALNFAQEPEEDLWFSLLYKVLEYRKKFTQMAAELINKGALGDINKLNKGYAEWAAANENPLALFAHHFNPLLSHLNLEVDLVNTEYAIPIKSKLNDEVIPISGLSTGTKGLLLSMFPLFELDTKDAIILIDEPERSLFPDMQINLMSYYQHMAPDAQFIVATHSPFIAAAFEPEERFILYFDEQGKVAVRRGESPIGDDPNDILRNDFKVDYYNEFGKKAYQKYLDLKAKIAQETEVEKKKKLVVELAELGDKYNF
jgi:AAA15 family ATPase/GTPase